MTTEPHRLLRVSGILLIDWKKETDGRDQDVESGNQGTARYPEL